MRRSAVPQLVPLGTRGLRSTAFVFPVLNRSKGINMKGFDFERYIGLKGAAPKFIQYIGLCQKGVGTLDPIGLYGIEFCQQLTDIKI